MCVLCSWNQTHLSTSGKETSSNTRMRWQMLHHQGTRPCCPLPGTWTVSPTARTGAAITRPTRRISRVRLLDIFSWQGFFFFLPIATGHWLFMQHCFFLIIIIYMLVLALCPAHVIVLLLCCWPSSDFISCIDSSTQIWNVIEMFVTSVQTCVSLLNEQMENIVISIKRLPSLITPVQWKF